MALRAGDSLMSMDVLPKDLADRIANSNLEIADAAADADADVDVAAATASFKPTKTCFFRPERSPLV